MAKLAQSGFKAVAVSQNQFYRENLPQEEDMQMPNYDHPGMAVVCLDLRSPYAAAVDAERVRDSAGTTAVARQVPSASCAQQRGNRGGLQSESEAGRERRQRRQPTVLKRRRDSGQSHLKNNGARIAYPQRSLQRTNIEK